MSRFLRAIGHPGLMPFGIVASLCAAALVLHYQWQAQSALESQTRVIYRQISEQTANDIAQEVRRTLDGPVLDTLLAVTHPELMAGKLGLVGDAYEQGLSAYPQVQRFFIWSKETEAVAPGEALFYQPRSERKPAVLVVDDAAFVRDTELGQTIMAVARRNRLSQHIYAAEELTPGGLQLFLRVYWTDAQRLDFYAVLGFLVSPDRLPDMFAILHDRSLASLLTQRSSAQPLELRVTDSAGRLVYGNSAPHAEASSVTVPMLFYPAARVETRLVTSGISPQLWRVEVSARIRDRGIMQGYWPTVFSVILMLGAFGLTVRANLRAAEVAQRQAEFVAHASHQLKTPLSLISAATETIEMAHVHTPEKLTQYLTTIRSESTRLSSLVQRILEFSRVEQARAMEFEEVALGPLVRETVEAFGQSLSARRFTFAVECVANPHVLADPAAIEQVLGNLLDNATKYSGDAREIQVRVLLVGNEACIEVIDRGPGIPKQERERIFEKFYRGSTAAHGPQGFGLGLPIVRELVRAHRGRVDLDEVSGGGSVFRVMLPAVPPARHNRAVQTTEVGEEVAP
jgi:signal transduction histidine kinase